METKLEQIAASAVKQLPKSVGAGNPHATFCGNRRRATASGDPVGRGNPVPYRYRIEAGSWGRGGQPGTIRLRGLIARAEKAVQYREGLARGQDNAVEQTAPSTPGEAISGSPGAAGQ